MGEASSADTPGVTDRDRDRTERTDSGDMDGVTTTLPVKQNMATARLAAHLLATCSILLSDVLHQNCINSDTLRKHFEI